MGSEAVSDHKGPGVLVVPCAYTTLLLLCSEYLSREGKLMLQELCEKRGARMDTGCFNVLTVEVPG